MMKILVTGVAGFIGFHVAAELLARGHEVIGLDNINDYYSPSLKFDRLKELGIPKTKASVFNNTVDSIKHQGHLKFVRMHLEDRDALDRLFRQTDPEVVCHLAAQAGVRYSIEHPEVYVQSNMVGFFNILESCRQHGIEHLVYASSSSVYGLNKNMPFSVNDRTDTPISLYAASKKSNELMAHAYSHLFKLRTTGLRFFTVYGPWGRPDMALFLFTRAILNGEPIKIYNQGKMERDFTYIGDITEGVVRIIELTTVDPKKDNAPNYNLYNIGNNKAVNLMEFIENLESELGATAKKEFLPLQPGDVISTRADVADLIHDFSYQPDTPVAVGIKYFVDWYKSYYLPKNLKEQKE